MDFATRQVSHPPAHSLLQTNLPGLGEKVGRERSPVAVPIPPADWFPHIAYARGKHPLLATYNPYVLLTADR